MGSIASNWTTVTTLSEGNECVLPSNLPNVLLKTLKVNPPSLSPPPAPQYVSPFSVDSNLTVIWLDWAESFALNGYLKEFIVTESKLRVYMGFYNYLHIPRTSQKSERHIQPDMIISTYT